MSQDSTTEMPHLSPQDVDFSKKATKMTFDDDSD